MGDPSRVQKGATFRVGLFTLLGIALVAIVTVLVNDRPNWWGRCQLVKINVQDATGLKNKSPVRSLGIQIGYIQTVGLSETHVELGICLTLPVEVLPETRAYIRGEGFLGDKFVELKPVKYVGDRASRGSSLEFRFFASLGLRVGAVLTEVFDFFPVALAQEPAKQVPVGKEAQDMQKLIERVDVLVGELTHVTSNVKDAFDPKEIKGLLKQLNRTLKNAGDTLSPRGDLTTTAQRALAKLEDAIEQLRQTLTRINQGEGSVGRIINDPVFAEELEKGLKNLNKLLAKTADMRFLINIGGQLMPAYDISGRGWFEMGIWPTQDRYYLLGVAIDPRGSVTFRKTETTVGSVSTETKTKEIEQGGIVFTAMLGKVLWNRLDLAAGIRYNDATLKTGLFLGPFGDEDRFQIQSELSFRSEEIDQDSKLHDRLYTIIFPSKSPYLHAVYLTAGLDTFARVNDRVAFFYGGGLQFDDDDIKLLFSFL